MKKIAEIFKPVIGERIILDLTREIMLTDFHGDIPMLDTGAKGCSRAFQQFSIRKVADRYDQEGVLEVKEGHSGKEK